MQTRNYKNLLIKINLFTLSKKQIYYIPEKLRNVEMLFNLGVNEIAIELESKSNLNILNKLFLKWNYRKLFTEIVKFYSFLLDETQKEEPDLKTIRYKCEQNLYFNLLNDLLKIKQENIILKNPKSKILIKPVNLFYVYGVELERSKNVYLKSGLLEKNSMFYKKIHHKENESSSILFKNYLNKDKKEIDKKNSSWLELIESNNIAIDSKHIENIKLFYAKQDLLEKLKTELISDLKNEFQEIFLIQKLGKLNEENFKNFSSLLDANKDLDKSNLFNLDLDKEKFTQDEKSYIYYFKSRTKYIEDNLSCMYLLFKC